MRRICKSQDAEILFQLHIFSNISSFFLSRPEEDANVTKDVETMGSDDDDDGSSESSVKPPKTKKQKTGPQNENVRTEKTVTPRRKSDRRKTPANEGQVRTKKQG